MKQNFDVVICVGVKDIFIVHKTVKYINQYIVPQHIFLIMNKRFFSFYSNSFLRRNHVTLLNEENIVEGITIKTVRQSLSDHFPKKIRAGWYLQQFLKMGFSLTKYVSDYYLVWDADTIPTSRLDFFDEKGRMMLAMKSEYHPPYFETMNRLLGLDKSVDFSFIAEHMIIRVEYMKEIINYITKECKGTQNWSEKIIEAVNPEHGIGFSEFETYGTYVHRYHQSSVSYRKLHTMRRAGFLFGRCMKDREIQEFNGVTDTISLEAGHIPPFPRNIYQYFQLCFLYLLRP